MSRSFFKRTSLDTGVLRIAILATITGLCLIVIVYLLTEVRQKLDELASSPTDNIQWTLSQLEVEFLEVILAVEAVQYDVAVDARDSTNDALAQLRKRYDILYSRFETLSQAKLYAGAIFDPALSGAFDQVRTAVIDLAPQIDSADPALVLALPDILTVMSGLRSEVRRILSFSNLKLVELSDAARVDVAYVLKGLAWASSVLLAALSAMVILFRSLAKVSNRRLTQKIATSERLETIFGTSRDAILMLDQRGRLCDANRAAEEMFQINEAADSGVPAGIFLRRDGSSGLIGVSGRELFDACRTGAQTGYRLLGHSRAGLSFPIELSMDVTNREGVAMLVCVVRDISHQVATEAELKSSRDQALAGERAKARFLGVISHEMRTPLNGILGTIDLMEDGTSPDEAPAMLSVIRNSAQTLLELVNDVLDITQIEGTEVAIHPAPFDLDRLISDILASEAPRAKRQGNRLLRDGAQQIGWVIGDATRVRQVLLNIVSNAVKFTENGEVTLILRRDDDRLTFDVRDTGIGMAEDECARIFDDFVRLDGATDRQIQGTGLGLGIAQRLANAMGGVITVKSAPNLGTTFSFTLPLPETAAVIKTVPEAEEPQTVPSQDILLVEDNPTNRFVARRMLERDGHRVTEAENGLRGVELSCEKCYDIILMDVSMPVMDGIEATAAIRSGTGKSRETRIIALTAHVGDDVTERLCAAGMDDVIAKPIRSRILRRLLAEASAADQKSSGRRSPRLKS